jgi:hypothetical protein
MFDFRAEFEFIAVVALINFNVVIWVYNILTIW